MQWKSAPDISSRINFLVKELGFSYPSKRIFCFRSIGSTGNIIARIWALPTIWQQALNTKPGYCLEVLSEKFDRRSQEEQEKILIHELLHIPSKFSGNLVPHRSGKRKTFRHYHQRVDQLFNSLPVKSYAHLSR
jgi:predicted metallopeptidase